MWLAAAAILNQTRMVQLPASAGFR